MKNSYDEIPILDNKIHQMLKESLNSSDDKSVFDQYLKLIDQLYQETVESFEESDDEAFAKQCHKLKSNMASLGYLRFSKICHDIEVHYKKDGVVTEAQKKIFLRCSQEYETHLK